MKNLGALALSIWFAAGCASVPPEVAQVHLKEGEIIEALAVSHSAMIDAYVEQRVSVFEKFYFDEYGPAFLTNWQARFKEQTGRAYDPNRDFSLFYNDLVAEYLEAIQPIDALRRELHARTTGEYETALEIHSSVGDWIESIEKLNSAQRQSIDRLLNAVKPGTTLSDIETAVQKQIDAFREKLGGLE
jgi:methionine aminopeptidase